VFSLCEYCAASHKFQYDLSSCCVVIMVMDLAPTDRSILRQRGGPVSYVSLDVDCLSTIGTAPFFPVSH
jgi:hypothetical protein